MKNIHFLPLLVLLFSLFFGNVAIAQPYPLRAQTYAVYNPSTSVFNSWDSVWYYYSGGREATAITTDPLNIQFGDMLSEYNILYDAAIHYGNFEGTVSWSKTINTYDSSGHVHTETRFTKDGSGAWVPSMLIIYTYTGDNRTFDLMHEWIDSAWRGFARTTYTYNAHNDIDTTVVESNDLFTGFVWGNRKRLIHTYDTAYNRTSVLIQNPDMAGWVNYGFYTFSYDTANNLLQRKLSEWLPDSTGVYNWFEFERRNHGYNSANDDVADTTYWLDTTGAWNIINIDSNVYDIDHNLILDVKQLPDTITGIMATARKYEWAFNSFGQCTSIASHTWNAATGSWALYSTPTYSQADYIHRYYYGPDANTPEDTSHPVTGINGSAAVNVEARVFPSPASDFIKIELNWADAQAFKVTLWNTEGQLLQMWNENATKRYTKTIDVAALPAGNYFFRITCNEGTKVRSFVVMH